MVASLPREDTPTVVLLPYLCRDKWNITTINIDRLRRTNIRDEDAMMKVPGRPFCVRLRAPLVDLFQARRLMAYIYGTFDGNSASSPVSPPGDVVTEP